MTDYTVLDSLTFAQRPGLASFSRYVEVYVNGEYISRHTSEIEATEASIAHLHTQPPGDYHYEFRTPNRTMSVRLISPTAGGQGTGAVADITPPLAPAGLATDTVEDTSFRLTWSSNSEPDLNHYNIYRSTEEFTGFSIIGQATPGQTTFTVDGLVAGTTYYVKMTAVDNVGNESEFSATVSATPVAVFWDTIDPQTVDDSYPSTITGLKAAHLNNGAGQVVTVHDRPVSGNDLVATGVVSYDDATDTLTVTENPGGKEIFLRASDSEAVVPTWANEPVA